MSYSWTEYDLYFPQVVGAIAISSSAADPSAWGGYGGHGAVGRLYGPYGSSGYVSNYESRGYYGHGYRKRSAEPKPEADPSYLHGNYGGLYKQAGAYGGSYERSNVGYNGGYHGGYARSHGAPYGGSYGGYGGSYGAARRSGGGNGRYGNRSYGSSIYAGKVIGG